MWQLRSLALAALGLPLATSVSLAQRAPAVDLDGDGLPEPLSEAGAGLAVGGKRGVVRSSLPGKPLLSTARAHTVDGLRLFALEVERGQALGRALWVAKVTIGPNLALSELATLPLGPQGPDAEYLTAASLDASGLWRWQERGELRACDGTALRLLSERWDPRSQRFVAAAPPLPAATGRETELVASQEPPAKRAAADVFRARWATSQQGLTRADELARPTELDDGDPRTVWRSASGWDGRGEALIFRGNLAAGAARRLRVAAGDQSSAAALRASARPAKLVIASARQRYLVTLPDPAANRGGAEVVVALPEPIPECLTVFIAEVHPGASTAASLAIGELAVETGYEDLAGGTSALAAEVARGGKEGAHAETILAERGAAAAQALAAELAAARDLAPRRRLVRALAKVAAPQSEAPITGALREGWLDEPDLEVALLALERIGAAAALVEIAASPQARATARHGAVAALAKRRDPRLLELAGVGDHELRRALISALAQHSAQDLWQAGARASSASAQGDLWRAAVRAAVRQGGAAQTQLVAELEPRLSSIGDHERRYRLVTGLAELAARTQDARLLARLHAHLQELARAQPEPAAALRQALAETLARHLGDAVTSELVTLAGDADPAVRLALARGLAAPEPQGLSVEAAARLDLALGRVLGEDGWPELRRAAATALAARCKRPGPASALERALDGDREVEVRQESLLALVTCATPGIAARLVRLWNGREPLALRARAVSLAVVLADPALAPELARSLRSWRSEAFSDEHALHLGARAAEALGRLGGPSAAPALLAALEDLAYPELVAAAANGLGLLGAACPAEAAARLSELSRSSERAIALAARRALPRCGQRPKASDPDEP